MDTSLDVESQSLRYRGIDLELKVSEMKIFKLII